MHFDDNMFAIVCTLKKVLCERLRRKVNPYMHTSQGRIAHKERLMASESHKSLLL